MALLWITRSTFVAIAVCLFSHGVAAQSKFIVWPKEPGKRIRPGISGDFTVLAQFDTLEIEEILVEGKPITIGQPFSASDEWLRTITIRVKNISNQRFSHIQIGLILPEIKDGKGSSIYVFYPFTADQRAVGFGPGEVIELKTWRDDKVWKWANDMIAAKMPLSEITTAQIREIVVHMPDGSSLLSECIRTANELNACPHPAAP